MILYLLWLGFFGQFFFQQPIVQWNGFEKSVRDQMISKIKAQQWFLELYPALKTMPLIRGIEYSVQWHFPVKEYARNDIGQGGFLPRGYNFYDGNQHKGHAALDIFVYDKNFDSLDDRTNQPILIAAPVDILILSVNTGWAADSAIRGGNYIWAWNPSSDLLFYFAHLDSILVKPGALIRQGETIATLGRSGKNAFPKRSPTHLHFTVLKVSGSNLLPYDYQKHFNTGF
jgi:hypothetical protein